MFPTVPPLVVIGEPDRWTSDLLCQLVRSARCDTRIITCQDGQSILEHCRRQRPALVIADCRLPLIGGLELLREVRRMPGTPPQPFFLITGKTDAASVRAAIPYAPTAYLAKPFKVDDLLERLRRVLLQPGEKVECQASASALPASLEEYLQQARQSDTGAPVLEQVREGLEGLSQGNALDLAQLIVRFRKDPQLTARLIAAANSAEINRGSPCQNLKQALLCLGLRHSLNLALGLALQRGVGLDDPLLAETGVWLWARSQRLAASAHWLAKRLDADAERCYTAGLLCRLGDLALLRALQDWHSAGGALDEPTVRDCLERHASSFGSALRTRWRLPLELRQLVAAAYQLGSGVYSREELILNLAAKAVRLADDQPLRQLAEDKAARMLKVPASVLQDMPRFSGLS